MMGTPAWSTLFPYTTLFRFYAGTYTAPDGRTLRLVADGERLLLLDRKSTRLNSSHGYSPYAVFCLKKTKRSRSTAPAPPTRRCRPRASTPPPSSPQRSSPLPP